MIGKLIQQALCNGQNCQCTLPTHTQYGSFNCPFNTYKSFFQNCRLKCCKFGLSKPGLNFLETLTEGTTQVCCLRLFHHLSVCSGKAFNGEVSAHPKFFLKDDVCEQMDIGSTALMQGSLQKWTEHFTQTHFFEITTQEGLETTYPRSTFWVNFLNHDLLGS